MDIITFSEPINGDEFIHLDFAKLFPEPASKCHFPIGRLVRDGKVSKVPCKSHSCPHCSKVIKHNTTKRFEHYCNPNIQYRMMTLTEWKHPSNVTNAYKLTYHWAKLRASLRKHNVKMIDFFWAKEYKALYTPNPAFSDAQNAIKYPHMHILVPAYIDIKLLKRLWFLATNHTADQVHIPEETDPALKNPAAYLTKYVTKADMQDGFHPRERRFGFSRNYKSTPVAYKYLKNGKVVTYIPFISDKSTLFFLNTVKLSDAKLIEIDEMYKQIRFRYSEIYPEEAHKFEAEQDGLENYKELIDERNDELDDVILEIGINKDYLIKMAPVVIDPSIQYAKSVLQFELTDMMNAELRDEYGFM